MLCLGILEQILKQRKGGNYYLYVSSCFSNNVIVVDYDFNNDGNPNDASIVGRILIVTSSNTVIDDKVADLAGTEGRDVLTILVVYN